MQVLAAHPSWVDAALTMQLLGDPAQRLALPAAPDYAAQTIALDADPLQGNSTVEVHATLANYGRTSGDSVLVELLAYPEGEALPDTLQSILEPPFSGERTLSFNWSTGARRGPWRLVLRLDSDDMLSESNEDNNALVQDVEIRASRIATRSALPTNINEKLTTMRATWAKRRCLTLILSDARII